MGAKQSTVFVTTARDSIWPMPTGFSHRSSDCIATLNSPVPGSVWQPYSASLRATAAVFGLKRKSVKEPLSFLLWQRGEDDSEIAFLPLHTRRTAPNPCSGRIDK